MLKIHVTEATNNDVEYRVECLDQVGLNLTYVADS